MAAFPHGLSRTICQSSLRLPSSVRVAVFSTRSSIIQSPLQTRFLSSTTAHYFAKPSARLQYIARAPPRSSASSDPVLRTVRNTREPVLLYKAPSKQLYMIGVYAFACSLCAAGLYTWKWRYELPKDLNLPFFVGPTYVLVGAIFMGIGMYIFSAPVARCTSIQAIPGMGSAVQLRITARAIPFAKDRVILADLGEASIDQKVMPVTMELREATRARNADITEDLHGMFIVRRGWELSARWIEQKWTSFFLRFKFAVLRFGIVKLKVHGDKWKIDCEGYLLENGKAIDRLIEED